MAITYVASASAQTPTLSGGSGAITSGIDTSTASLLVAITVANNGVAAISDSVGGGAGNTWETIATNSAGVPCRLFCVRNPTNVGASHVFTASNANLAAGIAVIAFTGTDTSAAVDGNANNYAGTGTVATGAFTPSASDVVVVLAAANDPSATFDAAYTLGSRLGFASGVAYGVGIAYKIFVGSAGSPNPTWTFAGNNGVAAFGAAFDPAGAATATWPGYIAPFGWR